jgi:uncharacterized OB-fold protein
MSDWSKVTRPIPVPNEWTKPFWDAARRGVLELQRCQSCGHFQHPPYATCTQCVATDLKFEPVRGVGTIYAYTIMYHTGDKRFASAVPYASIIVELDDAPGALLAGNLLEAEYSEAKVGRRVEVVFEKLNDDITLPQWWKTPSFRGAGFACEPGTHEHGPMEYGFRARRCAAPQNDECGANPE